MMAERSPTLLIRGLRDPETLPRLPPDQWDLLVRQARHADLLGRLAQRALGAGVLDRIPAAPLEHLRSALLLEAAQHADVRREVRHIAQALKAAGTETILLKGAAYVVSGSAAAIGRSFSDVDVLVPRKSLGEVEASLMMHGWATTHHSAYDQRYYREWMHELPPMRHIHRNSMLDVHHTIAPLTSRLQPDSQLLMEASLQVPGWPGVRVLAPADMVLHSATHLLLNEEFSHGLRDLSDLDLLMREHGSGEFWPALLLRARQLGLGRPLYYALRMAHEVFLTPVPADVLLTAQRQAPPLAARRLMEALLRNVLASRHATARPRWQGPAAFAMYVRAHWLRMPPLLLAQHLLRKAMTPQEN